MKYETLVVIPYPSSGLPEAAEKAIRRCSDDRHLATMLDLIDSSRDRQPYRVAVYYLTLNYPAMRSLATSFRADGSGELRLRGDVQKLPPLPLDRWRPSWTRSTPNGKMGSFSLRL